MKKYLLLAWSLLIIVFASHGASAQLIDTEGLEELNMMTDEVAKTANYGRTTIGHLVAVIIQTALGFLAVIFLVLVLFSGFRWMTAGGNEEQVKKATKTITMAVIGLVVVLAAFAITYFIFKVLPFGGGSVKPQGFTGG